MLFLLISRSTLIPITTTTTPTGYFTGHLTREVLFNWGIFEYSTDVNLRSRSIKTIDATAFRYFDSLIRIDLSNNEIQAIDPNFLSGARNLLSIDLSSNKIKAVYKSAFAKMTRLTVLNLNSNPIKVIYPNLKLQNGLIVE
jgi:Leucine-rich repeat (LRR) protein